MEMRAAEEIGLAEDLTPPLPPLTFCLHHPFLCTHCSACSLPLPDTPVTPSLPPYSGHSLLYCSPRCSSLDSHLHFSSSEHSLLCLSPPPPTFHQDSSNTHARLALRLIHILSREQKGFVDLIRIGGLMTNYEKLFTGKGDGNEGVGEEVLGMIKDGAAKMVLAGNLGDGGGFDGGVALQEAVAEAAMCSVLTNAVEVQDKSGRYVGVAVYDTTFSWINHSCSPNACYRFATMPEEMGSGSVLRIYPGAMDDGGSCAAAGPTDESKSFGPRIIVRSIKGIRKDEEVTITYTDLLQPKDMRRSELHAKYQFTCFCKRCSATPATYVDRALQRISVCYFDGRKLISDDDDSYRCHEAKLTSLFDDAVCEYLLFDNPETCCKKLGELLRNGYVDERLDTKLGKSKQQCIRLNEFHHLSLNAYTTLASAYRARASNFLGSSVENSRVEEALDMGRTSAAYSLLLAIVAHHLFLDESSLIASVATFWKNAGESLMHLSKSSMWDTVQNSSPIVSKDSFVTSHKCYQNFAPDGSKDHCFSVSHDQSKMFVENHGLLLNCIANMSTKVWNFLAQEGHLKEIKDAVDFGGLLRVGSSIDFETNLYCDCDEIIARLEAHEHTLFERMYLFELGVHCLVFGACLSSLCFGRHSQLTRDVVNLVCSEGILAS